jgi:hypothetical protein
MRLMVNWGSNSASPSAHPSGVCKASLPSAPDKNCVTSHRQNDAELRVAAHHARGEAGEDGRVAAGRDSAAEDTGDIGEGSGEMKGVGR